MLYRYNIAWALTPRFHPYPGKQGRYILCGTCCSHGVQPQDLPVRKYGALCCPDFPYPRTSRDTIEQVVTGAKVGKYVGNGKWGMGNRGKGEKGNGEIGEIGEQGK